MQDLSFLALMRSASQGSFGATTIPSMQPLCVLIDTHQRLYLEALRSLLGARGIQLETELHHACVAAIVDVSGRRRPYPAPPAGVPTLALVSGQEDDLAALLKLGYRGYVRTCEAPEVLLRALVAVHRGQVWAEPEILMRTLVELPHPTMTPRQREVLELLARGYSNCDIAQSLGIAVGTVKGHVTALLRVFNASSRLELVSSHLKAER